MESEGHQPADAETRAIVGRQARRVPTRSSRTYPIDLALVQGDRGAPQFRMADVHLGGEVPKTHGKNDVEDRVWYDSIETANHPLRIGGDLDRKSPTCTSALPTRNPRSVWEPGAPRTRRDITPSARRRIPTSRIQLAAAAFGATPFEAMISAGAKRATAPTARATRAVSVMNVFRVMTPTLRPYVAFLNDLARQVREPRALLG